MGMEKALARRTAVVTEGSSEIGLETARLRYRR